MLVGARKPSNGAEKPWNRDNCAVSRLCLFINDAHHEILKSGSQRRPFWPRGRVQGRRLYTGTCQKEPGFIISDSK